MGKKLARNWFSYSKSQKCHSGCELFSKTKGERITEDGVRDWPNIKAVLKSHEGGLEHADSVIKWRELAAHLSRGQTPDETQIMGAEKRKKRCRDVPTCDQLLSG